MRTAQIDLNLNEIELLLRMYRPCEQQDRGPYADSARKKLNQARIDLLGLFADDKAAFLAENDGKAV